MRNKPLHPPSTSSPVRLRAAVALVGALVGATVACSLNPQPLPPGEDDRIAADPTGAPSAGGTFNDAASTPLDAGSPPLAPDGAPVSDAGSDSAPLDAAPDVATDASPADAATDAATRD